MCPYSSIQRQIWKATGLCLLHTRGQETHFYAKSLSRSLASTLVAIPHRLTPWPCSNKVSSASKPSTTQFGWLSRTGPWCRIQAPRSKLTRSFSSFVPQSTSSLPRHQRWSQDRIRERLAAPWTPLQTGTRSSNLLWSPGMTTTTSCASSPKKRQRFSWLTSSWF